MPTLTAERLRALVVYDPLTGKFTNRITRGARAVVGRPTGKANPKGYIQIGIDGVLYYGHRLAWLYMTGYWPSSKLDHDDTNKANNAWINLREATGSQNQANTKAKKNNKLGVKGVSWDSKNGKYSARIMCNGKITFLGRFTTIEEAAAAYAAAAKIAFGVFART